MKKLILYFALLLSVGFVQAQNIVWTGLAANNDFFDEANWKNESTNEVPAAGSIDAGVAINLSLKTNNVAVKIVANGQIKFGTTGSLDLTKTNLTASSLLSGKITLNEEAYIDLTDTEPIKTTNPQVIIDFKSGIAWVRTLSMNPDFVQDANTSQLKVNGENGVYKSNLRLDNYYRLGCVIRSFDKTATPLTIYSEVNRGGANAKIPYFTIQSGAVIPNKFNNKMKSFLLKKGFMVTFADETDGTGKSKVYIASESDLFINEMPKALQNTVSFIRVLPWNWVTKKGRNQTDTDLRTSWRYQWNHTEESGISWEFAPMSWGHGTTTDSHIENFIEKYNSPHIMSFNEPDDCDGQSGQYGFPGSPKLCDIDEAVKLHKNFMKTGMRIVSPGGREEAPFGWLKEFHAKATAQDIRIDVIAVHWYDWGSGPSASKPTTAQAVFERFKNYLTRVHNQYGLPIWITEFNANPARSQAINAGFLALAMPYLESLEYVERYCWFAFNTNTHFYGWDDVNKKELNKTPTPVGIIYKNINNSKPVASTPSIPEVTLNQNSNLSLNAYPNIALRKPASGNTSLSKDYLPENAVDGNVSSASSQWIANIKNPKDSNYTPLPAWFEVDLNGYFSIDSFRIVEAFSAVKDFSFQVWDETLNSGAGGWKSALNVVGNPSTPFNTFKSLTTAVKTNKVRLYVTQHHSTDLLKMFELEVFGYPEESLKTTKFEKQTFAVYPNPVSDGFLNIKGEQEIENVEVYSVLGNKVNATYKNNQVDVSNLSAGIYFLKINNSHSFKFIKK